MPKFFILLLIFCIHRGYSQSHFNCNLKMQLHDRAGNNPNLQVLVKGNIPALKVYQSPSFNLLYSVGNIARINCDASTLLDLSKKNIIFSAEAFSASKRPLNDTMLVRNRIRGAKTGEAPLDQGYDGEGIVLGFVDTGIDVNHPDFKDSLGNTRVKFLWDQAQAVGSSVPQPYNYGIEWTAAQINASVCTHSDAPYNGHGTHVAGIAAGNGRATKSHFGIAPKADIVAVALNFALPGPTIADAVNYIFDKAAAMGKPCVVNISLGDYYGSHDGTDLEAQMIDAMLQGSQGKAVVAAAGNAGNLQIHTFTQPLGDTSFTWLQGGLTLRYWCYADTAQVKNLRFSVGVNRNNFTDAGATAFQSYTYGLQGVMTDTIFSNGNRIGVVFSSASINSFGVYERMVEIAADSSALYWRMETAGTGQHHAWNFGFVSTGLPSTTQLQRISKYVKADSLYTLVSSFQCSDEVLTVANYNSGRFYYDSNNNLQDNLLLAGQRVRYSSVGPTRDGRLKPDISAGGHNVLSAFVLSMLPSWLVNNPELIGKGGMHVLGGGTSAASPVVAGIAALYFQKNSAKTYKDLKKAVIDCSFRDQFTGFGPPDYVWGHGKIDGKNTLLCGADLVTIPEQNLSGLKVSPNPCTKYFVIESPAEGCTLEIFTSEGKKLATKKLQVGRNEISTDDFSQYHGLLILRFQSAGKNAYYKLLKD